MSQITIHTDINAPVAQVFDLARDAAFHVETARASGERIVAGRKTGLFDMGDCVTFEGKHLGVRQRLSAQIIEMNAPYDFTDEMTRGVFQSLRHRHIFQELSGGRSRMTDVLVWRSPFGILGIAADKIAVERHLRGFLISRAAQIKTRAETQTSTL